LAALCASAEVELDNGVDMSPEEALQEAIAAIRQHLDQLLHEPAGSEPTHLFHYTSSEGLLGILTNKKFFATDILSMRDQSEFRYGAELARKVVHELHETERSAITDSLLHPFEDDPLLGLGKGFFFHVVCFCEKQDVLTQWQTFSATGGFALGIDCQELVKGQAAGDFILAKMLYDTERQRDLVRRVVTNGIAVFRQFENSLRRSKESLDGLVFELGLTLYNLISRFKHPCFHTEDEWRILIAGEEDLKFRSVGRTVLPYREVGFAANLITHVIRSPGAWPANDRYSTERLARSVGEHVQVGISTLPFL
jgi:Protein of unknown function (DUF2971)